MPVINPRFPTYRQETKTLFRRNMFTIPKHTIISILNLLFTNHKTQLELFSIAAQENTPFTYAIYKFRPSN